MAMSSDDPFPHTKQLGLPLPMILSECNSLAAAGSALPKQRNLYKTPDARPSPLHSVCPWPLGSSDHLPAASGPPSPGYTGWVARERERGGDQVLSVFGVGSSAPGVWVRCGG